MRIGDKHTTIREQNLSGKVRRCGEDERVTVGHILQPLGVAAIVTRRAFHFDHHHGPFSVQAENMSPPSDAEFELAQGDKTLIIKPTADPTRDFFGDGCWVI